MTHSNSLGIEILFVMRIGGHADGYLLHNLKSIAIKADDLLGIIRE